MIRSRYISAIAIAAMFGAANTAFAADASAKSVTNAATAPTSKPLCSTLGHPQAGKLAGKDTGMAKDHSNSAVHQDCIPDAQAGASANNAASSTANSTSSPSVTGSSTSVNSAVTGSSAGSDSSVTGSTSTFDPNIDLRGRSSLTIDNATTTGDQSLSSTTSATTGNQSATSSADTATSSSTTANGTSKKKVK